MTEKQYGIHDYRYQFRVIANDKEEISRIFFEEKVTGEIIEGKGNITQWINKLVNENEQLVKEKDYYKRELQKELVCQAIINGRRKE